MLDPVIKKKLDKLYKRVTEGDLSNRTELSKSMFISSLDLIISESKVISERSNSTKKK